MEILCVISRRFGFGTFSNTFQTIEGLLTAKELLMDVASFVMSQLLTGVTLSFALNEQATPFDLEEQTPSSGSPIERQFINIEFNHLLIHNPHFLLVWFFLI